MEVCELCLVCKLTPSMEARLEHAYSRISTIYASRVSHYHDLSLTHQGQANISISDTSDICHIAHLAIS